jgi:hypothetical protein
MAFTVMPCWPSSREPLGQVDEDQLRHGVGAATAGVRGGRGLVDDAPPTTLDHQRSHRLSHQQGAVEVDRKGAAPVADIYVPGDGDPARPLDQFDRLGREVVVQVGHDDRRPVSGQRDGVLLADAPATAGDHRDPPVV